MLTHWPLGDMAIIITMYFQNQLADWYITNISRKTPLMWMLHFTLDGNSTLVQVMAWCCQATSHYLSQYWHRSMSLYGITRPQCVNSTSSNTQCLKLMVAQSTEKVKLLSEKDIMTMISEPQKYIFLKIGGKHTFLFKNFKKKRSFLLKFNSFFFSIQN